MSTSNYIEAIKLTMFWNKDVTQIMKKRGYAVVPTRSVTLFELKVYSNNLNELVRILNEVQKSRQLLTKVMFFNSCYQECEDEHLTNCRLRKLKYEFETFVAEIDYMNRFFHLRNCPIIPFTTGTQTFVNGMANLETYVTKMIDFMIRNYKYEYLSWLTENRH